MREENRTVDREIAAIGSRQYGNITREQLITLDVSSSAIGRRVDKGQLIAQYRGVYRIGHTAPSTEATYMAAVLAAGEGALLSGRAAAHLMRLLNGAPPPPEVIAPKERRIDGVESRHERHIDPRDRAVWQGIPTTTVARTLVDLAADLPGHALGG